MKIKIGDVIEIPLSDQKKAYGQYVFWDKKMGKASIWFLWNGNESIRLGDRLPEKYRKMEFLVTWSPFDVVDRIETRKYPYPYGDLINFNEFKPSRKDSI